MDQLGMFPEPLQADAPPPTPPRPADLDRLRARLERLLTRLRETRDAVWLDAAEARFWNRLFLASVEFLPQEEAVRWRQAFNVEFDRIAQRVLERADEAA